MERSAARRLIAALAVAALAASTAPAPATPTPLVIATYFQFIPGGTPDPVQLPAGTPMYLSHQDPVAQTFYTPWHDITSEATDEDGQPLFASDLLGFQETGQVYGVEDLPPGTYRFYCSSHSADLNMRGELVVLDLL